MRVIYNKLIFFLYRHRSISISLLVLLITASSIFFPPSKAHAVAMLVLVPIGILAVGGLIAGITSWANDSVKDALVNFFIESAGGLLSFGFHVVNVSLSLTNTFLDNGGLTAGWQQTRNLSLEVFGIAILVIAFMNMLKIDIQVWGVNKIIPKLFLAVFFILFSKFICFSIINFATALGNTFLQQFGSNIFSSFQGFSDGLGKMAGDNGGVSAGIAFVIFLACFIAFFILIFLAIILFVRILFLFFLIVLSPLAFTLFVLPFTKKMFMQWLMTFIKWTFFLPFCLLILSVSTNLAAGINNPDLGFGSYYLQNQGGETVSTFFSGFGAILITLVAIPLSVFFPLKMLGAVGEYAQGVMKGDKGPSAPFSPKRARESWNKMSKASAKKRESRGFWGNTTGLGRYIKTKGEKKEADKKTQEAKLHQDKWNEYKRRHPEEDGGEHHPPIMGGSGDKIPPKSQKTLDSYLNSPSVQPIKHGSETKPIHTNVNIPTTIATRHPAEPTTNSTTIPPRPTPQKEDAVKTKPGGPGGPASWTPTSKF